ncbi:protein BUNDLE SHEATH DEFECTIVE 2, chloroplastic [Curcuma longa]|uniref:protein BUNDLE SHEATH DEFECTIVE 2, chloroplastic n=1 Tax=Curcuma longa TaxID=136217 RepID=UPI003D9DCF14
MASVVCCFTSVGNSANPPLKPSLSTCNLSQKSNLPFQGPIFPCGRSHFQSFKAKAAENDAVDTKKGTKTSSLVCAECDGNGAKLCTQCEGSGVNSVDHFNGQFKAGRLCWLCRGKKEILCGNCNGAGFLGGYLSTLDETST